jgi:hypothetical protein
MASSVREIVQDLAAEGYERIHASYVAKRAEVSAPAARHSLAKMVADRDLSERFELVCPNCGRTLATYTSGEALPIGATVECHSCDIGSFVVSLNEIWITYTPTPRLYARSIRAAKRAGQKKALQVTQKLRQVKLSKTPPRPRPEN